ncbi:barstar family protein [Gordonia zhaorongruii]|uniref:barstar family protein n=1 Tax=Gordonia zhaorongruii TaxID=2597659 RepID=UPI00117F2730|nr:barstar family protein [Gordonia zhaorongruii]
MTVGRISDFLHAAASGGSAVGLTTEPVSTFGTGSATRRVDASSMRTVSGIFDELARAWRFPDHFGRNKDALDDCMRDLPTRLRTPEGGAATTCLTVVTHAEQLLADEPDELDWFAESIDFWSDAHRAQGRGFAFLLIAADDGAVNLHGRWAATDSPISDVDGKG